MKRILFMLLILAACGVGPVWAKRASDAQAITFGVRLEPGLVFPGMGDFKLDSQAFANQVFLNPGVIVTTNATAPGGYPNITLEPVVRILPQVEVGLPIGLGLVSSYSWAVATGGGTGNETIGMSDISVGLDGRYLFKLAGGGKFQPFVGGGAALHFVGLKLTTGGTGGGGSYSTVFNPSENAFGVQFQGGADYHVNKTFSVSAYVGYQIATAGNFTGNQTTQSTYGGTTTTTVTHGGLYMVANPPYGQQIQFVSDAALPYAAVVKATSVDLSGPMLGLQASMSFE